MASFQVGDAIAQAMVGLGDVAVTHSRFDHPWPGAVVEQGFGRDFNYFWDNLQGDGSPRLVIHPVGAGDGGDETPPPDPPRLLQAIDVSSHQSRDLTGYIAMAGAEHVIVRMYMQGVEAPSTGHSIAQADSARALGCSVGAYGWLYTGINNAGPRLQVQKQLATAFDALLSIDAVPVMWQDIEHYEGSLPTPNEIDQALDECARQSVLGGIYTRKGVWDEIGSPSFPGTPLWVADYDGIPDLDNSEPFGDMVLVAKQYTSTAPDGSPLDMDVILSQYTQP